METLEFTGLRPGRIEGWEYNHQVHDLGQLVVSSGRLEISDPFVNLGRGFVISIPPGEYPARVTLADVSDEQDGSHLRETYLSLILAEGEVARATYLVPQGKEAPEADEYYGIAVDAGTVGFADADALARCMPKGNWYEELFDSDQPDSWFKLMDSPDHYIEGSANIVMPLATAGENVVLAHSGWGDGFYPVVGTYDAAGKLLGVHIDLEVDERIGSDSPESANTPPETP